MSGQVRTWFRQLRRAQWTYNADFFEFMRKLDRPLEDYYPITVTTHATDLAGQVIAIAVAQAALRAHRDEVRQQLYRRHVEDRLHPYTDPYRGKGWAQ